MDKVSFTSNKSLQALNNKQNNAAQNTNTSSNPACLTNNSSEMQFLSFKGDINTVKMNSDNNITNKLALSEKDLDDILKNKTTEYNFNPVEPYNKLKDGDKKALKHLVKAGQMLDQVFLKQDNAANVKSKAALEKAAKEGNMHAAKALKIFNVFNGVVGNDGLSPDDVQLFKDVEKTKGKNLYPTGVDEKKLANYIKEHPEKAPELLSNDTIVKETKNGYMGVPYSIEFKKEYEGAAKELYKAAKETTSKDLAKYLRLQAQALTSPDPEFKFKADKAWANMKDSPLEFTIGRESYDDQLTATLTADPEVNKVLKENGITAKSKDMIGVRVGIVDQESTEKLKSYGKLQDKLDKEMPHYDEYKQLDNDKDAKKKEDGKQNVSDIYEVYLGGDYRACRPGITIAQNLPNDDKLSAQLGAGRKNVFHKQIRQTVNPEARKKLLDNLVDPSLHKLYDAEADHKFTIGHEISHGIGPKKTRSGEDKKNSLGEGIGDIIEESKADLGSLVFADHFADNPKDVDKILLTWAVKQLPLSKPPIDQPHRTRELMQLNYFREKGAIKFEAGGKLSIASKEKMQETAQQMLGEIVNLQLEGNSDKAKKFVEKYTDWNDAAKYASKIRKSLEPKPYKILKTPLADEITKEK